MSGESDRKKLFCFGYGYTCDYLAQSLKNDGGWDIAGTTRDLDKQQILKRHRDVEAYIFDREKPLADPRYFLDGVTHVLISTPPGDAGDFSFIHHGEDLLNIPSIEWVGYLSTIGVYGDRQGQWIDETTTIKPESKRGSRRARAEEQWLSLYEREGLPVHIFRLAGIYGPGRCALDSIRAGVARRIDKPGHAFNRVHVEDIVNVLKSSMAHPNPGSLYNVADDNPTPSHVTIAYACELLGMDVPPLLPYAEVDLSPMARSFYADNKRVRNDKIKNELSVTLKYPDYRSGLEACLAVENNLLEQAGQL